MNTMTVHIVNNDYHTTEVWDIYNDSEGRAL